MLKLVEQHPATLPTQDADSLVGAQEPKTLEDFENETYDALKSKKAKAKAKAKNAACVKNSGGMKRPASALHGGSQAAGAHGLKKKVPCGQGKEKNLKASLKLGCGRCKGSRNGCDTCLNPQYKGKRLSRDEWKAAHPNKK